MKAKNYAAGILCAAAFGLILYAGSRSGALPDAGDPAALSRALGALTLLPPVLAVALAFLTKDVVASLAAGLVSGVGLAAAVEGRPLLDGAVYTFTQSCRTAVDVASTPGKCAVLILCVVIGGMVEVIRRSGGFEALAQRLIHKIDTPRKANLIGELLGVIVFFDDYANALIVGPVMQPVTDKLGVSREKLAYIVDSTAAPVTGIAIISSWVAVEVSVINEGMALAGLPGSGYALFLASIPYCFYCIFCLLFIFESSLLGREFGPMLKSEIRARNGQPLRAGSQVEQGEPGDGARIDAADRQGRRIFVAVGSIVLLIAVSVITFYTNGLAAAVAGGEIAPNAPFSLEKLAMAFGSADTIVLVMEAAILASVVSMALGCAFRLFTFKQSMEAWLRGAASLMTTIVILVLAWSLAAVVERLGTVHYVVEMISAGVPWQLVPTLIFVACCLISFAAGSYGSMFIAMPMAIPIACAVSEASAVADSRAFLLLCIASVLSGSIFGDHCSPITDCTILSSLGSGCENMDHVQTQMPYALTTAAVSVLFGTLLTALGMPVWLSLLAGCAALFCILLVFGKTPTRTIQDNEHNE